MAAGKAVELKKEIDGGVYANIDVGLMTRLVQNLWRTPSNTRPRAGMSPSPCAARATLWPWAVADDGIGIAKKGPATHLRPLLAGGRLPRRGPRQRARLSMVKQIAEAHGGSISVKSAPGEGEHIHLPHGSWKLKLLLKLLFFDIDMGRHRRYNLFRNSDEEGTDHV